MAIVIFALGSNIGDRRNYLEQACNRLKKYVTNFRESHIIETSPLYVIDQPAFLNQVVMGYTEISVTDIFYKTQRLQEKIGRTKTYPNGPREIDIDMLYYNDLIIHTPDLIIPHPRIAERLFVLEPLCAIAPDWTCPVTRKNTKKILADYHASHG